MADWARYMYENPDVYRMFSDGGKWSWANGRQQGAYQREDGSMLQQESAAQYAQNHYNNFGKREGRKVHEGNGTNYASKLGGGGGSGGLNPEVEALQKLVMGLTESLGEAPTAEQVKEIADAGAGMQRTVLTDNYLQDDDKKPKKSFLQPIG
jgi:hypothetical protein